MYIRGSFWFYRKCSERLVPVAVPAVAAVASTAATTVSAPATAAAATAEAASTAASAVAASATAATTTAAAPLFAGTRFVDGKCPAVVLLTIQGRNRGRGLLIRGHFDKSKSFAAPGVTIIDDLCRNHLAMRSKQLFEFRAIDTVAQVPDIQLLTHRNLL
jgi:hypothetical protein